MKLLQLNVTANWGSTGKIAEGIGVAAMARGWESAIAYGRYHNPSQSQLIDAGSRWQTYAHYARHRLLDGEGLGSSLATRRLISRIREYAPDIIHLHNIHDHWLNYPLLFRYLATVDTPVVWTFHDCWAFTGGCAHFVQVGCDQWTTACRKCPYHKKFYRGEARNFTAKMAAYASVADRLTIVSVSSWLDSLVAQSQLASVSHTYIYNGLDTNIFRPLDYTDLIDSYGLRGKRILLGVSSVWPASKGLDDYVRLSKTLDDSVVIVLIGLPANLHAGLPRNIIPIERTQDMETLARWYSAADAVLSLSKAETFGLTLAEGLACGTPSIGYAATAIKEIIHPDTGLLVPPGDISALADAVRAALRPGRFDPADCRRRAVTCFDKDTQFARYVDLYQTLLH